MSWWPFRGLLRAGVAAPCDAFLGRYSCGGAGVDSERGGEHWAWCGAQELAQSGGSAELDRQPERGEAVAERSIADRLVRGSARKEPIGVGVGTSPLDPSVVSRDVMRLESQRPGFFQCPRASTPTWCYGQYRSGPSAVRQLEMRAWIPSRRKSRPVRKVWSASRWGPSWTTEASAGNRPVAKVRCR